MKANRVQAESSVGNGLDVDSEFIDKAVFWVFGVFEVFEVFGVPTSRDGASLVPQTTVFGSLA
jgi:hypothetical protein